jgi:hypothetical protein
MGASSLVIKLLNIGSNKKENEEKKPSEDEITVEDEIMFYLTLCACCILVSICFFSMKNGWYFPGMVRTTLLV